MTTTWNIDESLQERFDEGFQEKMLNLISAGNQFNVAEVNISPDGDGVKVAYWLNKQKPYTHNTYPSLSATPYHELSLILTGRNINFEMDGISMTIQNAMELGQELKKSNQPECIEISFPTLFSMQSALNFGNPFVQKFGIRPVAEKKMSER